MRLQIIALTLCVFLTACSQTLTGNAGLSVPVYSKERRQSVYNEVTSCNVPETIEFLKDYKVLRDQAKVK